MPSRDIMQCEFDLRILYQTLKFEAVKKNLYFILTCTSRSFAEQQALYAQGREVLEIVNPLRMAAGLSYITKEQNKYRVTWTMDSKHIVGKCRSLSEAFDIAITNKNGKIFWDLKYDYNHNEIGDYLELAYLGKSIGLACGAFFSHPDYPHFELRS